MQGSNQSSKPFQIIVIIVLALIGINLTYIDWNLLRTYQNVEPIPQAAPAVDPILQTADCDANCLKQVDQKVSQALATISGKPAQSTKVVTVTQTSKTGTTYIPLNGSSSTLNTDWVDLPATDVYIKSEDYGKNPYISFEASLKTSHEGGRVYARLFDVTNSIAVEGSEISTDQQSYTQVSTMNLPFWSGNNLYRVQIRSLDNQEVFYSSGRVKIVAK